ncbi:MAG: pitrilysin family protein [Limosilactobacillus sp.]|uniref:EF-P 5-aminopentanol modification-associated protein YfmF n=1 Tax=Limosilactobacillus sp. TaxID=2773925 RepID=UPI002700F60C|nr:pitrilysin family protein [Limosilactobacillus sp.]
MHYRLASGVNLDVIPSKKFNMNQILINFATPQTSSNATERNLLSNLLETSTKKYPTQTALADQLAKQYGTYLSTGVSRIGQMHCMRLKASFVTDQLADTDLFNQVVDLISEILFNPLVEDGKFDQATFDRQAINLKSTIDSYYDDKQFWAGRSLMDLYYKDDSVMKVPSFGRSEDVDALTPSSVYQAYKDMIDSDRVDILFLGDVDEDHVRAAFAKLPFKDRDTRDDDILYHQDSYKQVQRHVEYQPISQAKLNIGYSMPIYSGDDLYYAALVFNDLFGGSPYSKLFINVRERASLAYYASSRFTAFNGFLSVQSGIDSRKARQVEELIDQQLVDLQNGQFTDEEMAEVKSGLVNQYLSSTDAATNILGRKMVRNILGLSDVDTVAKINAVTRDQVVQVAKTLSKQAVYLLSGEN